MLPDHPRLPGWLIEKRTNTASGRIWMTYRGPRGERDSTYAAALRAHLAATAHTPQPPPRPPPMAWSWTQCMSQDVWPYYHNIATSQLQWDTA